MIFFVANKASLCIYGLRIDDMILFSLLPFVPIILILVCLRGHSLPQFSRLTTSQNQTTETTQSLHFTTVLLATMHFTLLTTLALAASYATATAIAGVSSNVMVAEDWNDSVTCGQKNPSVNMVIQNFCDHNNALTVGTAWARNGVVHDGYKVSITGPNCAADSKWIPMKYCNAQFEYMCANVGNAKGVATSHFGKNQCQTWKIEHVGGAGEIA